MNCPTSSPRLRSLLKWAERIEHPSQASHLTARAFQEMLSGRPGPVALEMPWDQFTASAEITPQDPLPLTPEAVARPRAHRRTGEAAERGEGADALGRWRRAACRERKSARWPSTSMPLWSHFAAAEALSMTGIRSA